MNLQSRISQSYWFATVSPALRAWGLLERLGGVPSSAPDEQECHVAIPAWVADTIQHSSGGNASAELLLLIAAVECAFHRCVHFPQAIIGTVALQAEGRPGPVFVVNAVDGQQSFQDLVGAVRGSYSDGRRHGQCDLQALSVRLATTTPLSINAFDIGVSHGGIAGQSSSLLEPFRVQVHLERENGCLRLRTSARDGILGAKVLKGLSELVVDALGAGLTSPQAKIHGLLSPRDAGPIEPSSPELQGPTTGDLSVVDLMLGGGPDDVTMAAVRCGEHWISYEEMWSRAARVQDLVAACGIRREDRVAVIMRKGLNTPSMVVGILASGGVYVPVDRDMPMPAISRILDDCSPNLVFVDDDLLDSLPQSAPPGKERDVAVWRVVAASELERSLTGATPSRRPERVPTGQHLAYVLYTSGTTGAPMGVMVEHRSIVSLLNWYKSTYCLGSGTVLLQLTPTTFDPSIEQILGVLYAGGTLVMADHREVAAPDRLAKTVSDRGVNIVNATPTVLKELLSNRPKIPCLSQIISGGDVLDYDLKESLLSLGYRVYNHYGPTECTVDALSTECLPGVPVTIGSPVWGTRALITNHGLQCQPLGVAGELLLMGEGVSRGYLRAPAKTAAAFVPDMCTPGGRAFRTGDTVRWRDDVGVEFLFRSGSFVKMRGTRVSLASIEKVLSTYPGVNRGVAVSRCARDGDTEVIAVVEATSVAEAALCDYLLGQLPTWSMPARVRVVDQIPILASGKIDYPCLLEVADGRAGSGASMQPLSDTQSRLHSIWKAALERDDIGVDDDFFAKGGQSIAATRVVNAVYREFGVDVSLRQFFQNRTISGISRVIDEQIALRGTLRSTDEPSGP